MNMPRPWQVMRGELYRFAKGVGPRPDYDFSKKANRAVLIELYTEISDGSYVSERLERLF